MCDEREIREYAYEVLSTLKRIADSLEQLTEQGTVTIENAELMATTAPLRRKDQ